MCNKVSFLLLLIFSGLSGYGQTLYELTYHFQLKNGRENYKALLLRNEDGTGTIRLEYYDLQTKGRNLVEMDIVESYGEDENGNEDTSMLIYVGLDQRLILGKVLYKPDHFVFALNKESHFYEPDFVLSINDDGTEDIGTLEDAVLLNQEDLTKERILQYFTKDDEIYQDLFVNVTKGLTPTEQQTQLFLVLVANTNDKSIGKTCIVDRDATLKTFSEIAEFLHIQFKPTIIAGNDFSKKNVENAVNSLRPGKRDIVVFYYTGHGFNQPGAGYAYPFMDLRDKSFQTFGGEYTMNVENVYNNIKAKGARLNLVFSDCCNNLPGQTSNINPPGATTRSSSIGWDMQNCKLLFMRDDPMSLLMTAAQKGELSAGNTEVGGIFTSNFRECIEKKIRLFASDVSWDDLVISAKAQTTKRANRSLCEQADESTKRCLQNPIYKIEKF